MDDGVQWVGLHPHIGHFKAGLESGEGYGEGGVGSTRGSRRPGARGKDVEDGEHFGRVPPLHGKER